MRGLWRERRGLFRLGYSIYAEDKTKKALAQGAPLLDVLLPSDFP